MPAGLNWPHSPSPPAMEGLLSGSPESVYWSERQAILVLPGPATSARPRANSNKQLRCLPSPA